MKENKRDTKSKEKQKPADKSPTSRKNPQVAELQMTIFGRELT